VGEVVVGAADPVSGRGRGRGRGASWPQGAAQEGRRARRGDAPPQRSRRGIRLLRDKRVVGRDAGELRSACGVTSTDSRLVHFSRPA